MDNASDVAWLIRGVQKPPLTSTQEAVSLEALEIVALTAEYRRLAAGGHNFRVAQLSALIGKKLGLSDSELELLKQAAPLHDIGTVFIPERILLKPSKLSSEEFDMVKRHVNLGKRLIQDADSALLQTARLIIEGHHERFDGSGYPSNKRGSEISPIAQIVALADVFDSATHPQPYREALPVMTAVRQVREQRGKGFEPGLVDIFTRVLEEHAWLVRERTEKVKRDVLLRGKLGTLNLFDLLGSLTQNRKSGKLSIYIGAFQSTILLYEGRILHADFDGQKGEEALLTVFTKAEESVNAKFILETWPTPGVEEDMPELELLSIRTPTAKLLFDIAVKLDHEMSRRSQE
jgi:HD domain/Domain of unknown function (DUF4388)